MSHSIEQSNVSKESKSIDWTQLGRKVGNVVVGSVVAFSPVAGVGLAVATHTAYELHDMEVSVDPLGLERDIAAKPMFDDPTLPFVGETPPADEAPQDNPFLGGINS